MSDVQQSQPLQSAEEQRHVPLPLRNDNFLGVCEALGQDLRIHPNFIRVLFGIGLIFQPVIVIGAYLGLGVLVALTRWFAPDVRAVAPAAAPSEAADAEDREEIALAA